MAAALAPGRTVIRNAASEPHVQELACFLNADGRAHRGHRHQHADRRAACDGLRGGEYTIGPDYIEVGSLHRPGGGRPEARS